MQIGAYLPFMNKLKTTFFLTLAFQAMERTIKFPMFFPY